MKPTTDDEIAADRAVIDAATSGPGPWTAPGYEVWAAFIAAARTGWPRALDALEVMADAVVDEMARAEKAEAEVARLRDAVLAYCADDDSHTDSCALWLPYPTGTEPACDCPVRALRAALDREA